MDNEVLFISNFVAFVTLIWLILAVHASINKKLSSIRAKQIKPEGWIRSKEERLMK